MYVDNFEPFKSIIVSSVPKTVQAMEIIERLVLCKLYVFESALSITNVIYFFLHK